MRFLVLGSNGGLAEFLDDIIQGIMQGRGRLEDADIVKRGLPKSEMICLRITQLQQIQNETPEHRRS